MGISWRIRNGQVLFVPMRLNLEVRSDAAAVTHGASVSGSECMCQGIRNGPDTATRTAV